MIWSKEYKYMNAYVVFRRKVGDPVRYVTQSLSASSDTTCQAQLVKMASSRLEDMHRGRRINWQLMLCTLASIRRMYADGWVEEFECNDK